MMTSGSTIAISSRVVDTSIDIGRLLSTVERDSEGGRSHQG